MTIKPIHFGLVAVLLLFGLAKCNNDVKEILNNCCKAGEKLAESGDKCSDLNQPLDVVPQELISSCLYSSEICCSSKVRIEECKTGVLAAKDGKNCHGNVTEFYTSCCESCKVGLVVGASNIDCTLDNLMYGTPFDDAFHFCCRSAKADGSFYLQEGEENDLCGRFENLCSQICENTDGSYVCKCEAGFRLLADKITCAPDADAENDVYGSTKLGNSNSSEECEIGYQRQLDNAECVDIDECESSDVLCQSQQYCYNTLGSYKCLDILLPSGSEASVDNSPKKCSDGLRHNAKTDECDDINECLEQIDNCDRSTQLCLNLRGGFECELRVIERCLSGFQFDDVSKTCQDIDECEMDKPCGPYADCVNNEGGFECIARKTTKSPLMPRKRITCAEGFKPYFDKCIDIDECAMDQNACDSNQFCTNSPGSYKCHCKIGFSLDKVTNACVDINECQINNHDCLETQRCDNTIGSYSCIRVTSCGTGYTLNAGTGLCDDDDECVLNRHNCVKPYECRNTKGSFRCDRPRFTTTPVPPTTTPTQPPISTTPRAVIIGRYQQYRMNTEQPPTMYTSYARNEEYDRHLGPCQAGFERNSQGACADIDECYNPNACQRNQRCINLNGSYRCDNLLVCPGGYQSNVEGTQCIDIDECATGEARCESDQVCDNKPGGYTCKCPSGFMLKNRRCEDINECDLYRGSVCPLNTKCFNSIGSYRCECLPGYKKINQDDKVCVDIDECKDISGLCGQRCINFVGSYRCGCDQGYVLNANNRTCDDIDECEVHKGFKLCMGICENTPGSYRCACPDGYRIGSDGQSCQDINECELGLYCTGHSEMCTNTRGSYRCTQMTCPPDYIRDGQRKNRCERVSTFCDKNDEECFKRPSSIQYNFVTIVAKNALPPQGRGLFTLVGPHYYEHIDFDFKIINVRSNIGQRVTERFFKLDKMGNDALLTLMQSLDGPQDIETELSMAVYQDGRLRGTNIQRIFIYVSEFSY